jgi:serine/threonine-protein kinase
MQQRIGEYEVRFEIGRGGFGRVYLGYDPRVGRSVAIKVIDKAADLNMVGRFRAEANAAGNLRHKNIVTIYGYGEDDGQAYLVMEYLEGRDLHQLIEKKVPLTLLEKVSILTQIADGLFCAHRNGVIHRDVKPANVMVLGDGSVKIMDFGIARLLREGAARLTEGSDLVGTISYMAPEQFTDVDVDALCDIWAFGVMFYELLSGVHPFAEKTPGAIMYRITNVDPKPVQLVAQDCPASLERIVTKLLSRDRENRYQSMEDVQFEIAPVLRELQKLRASALVIEATALLREARLDEANALIGSIIELDASNEEARELRREIQEQRRQRRLRPKMVALLRQAELDAAKRDFRSAIVAADAALRLDPEDTAIRHYRSNLQRAWEGAEAAIQLTNQARQQMELLDLTGAFEIVTNALRSDPANVEAQRLMELIRSEMEAREEQRRLRDQLNRAEVFLSMGALDDAGTLVYQLGMEHPESVEVSELAARLRGQRTEAALRERLRAEVSACRHLLRTGELVEAVNRLESLTSEFAAEDQPRELLESARQELQTRERKRFCEETERQVWGEIGEKHFAQAQEILDRGLEVYPSERRLHELAQAIAGSKSGHEKALYLEDQLRQCGELQNRGELEEALAALEALRGDYGDDPRVAAQHEEIRGAILELGRARAVEATAELAAALLSAHQPDSAAELLQRAIGENGKDSRLVALLAEATAALQQAEAQRDLAWRIETVAEYERALKWDAALVLVKEGAEIHGDTDELRRAGERIEIRQRVEADVKEAESSVHTRDWRTARSTLLRAQAEHPGEPVWQELADRVRAGEMEDAIERNLTEGQLERARDSIAQARESALRIARLDVLEAQLQGAELRRAGLEQAQALTSSRDYAQAQAILDGLPDDPEVTAARAVVQQRRWEQERASRRQAGLDEARRLVSERQFEAAIGVLERALRESGPDAEVEEELKLATGEQQRILAEARYVRDRQEAGALVARGEHKTAVQKYRDLLSQYPADAELAGEAANATAAWQAETKKQAFLRERDRALTFIREEKYDEALGLLQPLLQEYRNDPVLQDAWRAAMTARSSRSDWLGTYQQISEIEELYQRGKVEKVRERCLRLLASIEEPRVRQMLAWAEEELARNPPVAVSFSMPRREDLPAIFLGPVSSVILTVWILAMRR